MSLFSLITSLMRNGDWQNEEQFNITEKKIGDFELLVRRVCQTLKLLNSISSSFEKTRL